MEFYFKPTIQTKTEHYGVISLSEFQHYVFSDKVKEITAQCKGEKDKTTRNNLKRTLPSFLACQDVDEKEHKVSNGLFQFDLDISDNSPDVIERVRECVRNLDWVVYVMTSPSGGLKFAVRTDFYKLFDPSSENYLDVFKSAHRLIEELVKSECGDFENDSSMETLTQTCLIAYDPHLYVNPNAVEYGL